MRLVISDNQIRLMRKINIDYGLVVVRKMRGKNCKTMQNSNGADGGGWLPNDLATAVVEWMMR